MASLDAPHLLGSWKFAGSGPAHGYFFGAGGELIRTEGERAQAMLTWKVDGEVLLIDQPSAPRIDRVPFQLASETTLQLAGAWYVKEPQAPRDIVTLALVAGAAWYAAENCHPSGAPFIPFLLIERGTRRVLERIVADTAQGADEAAFERVQREAGARIVWARDGRVRTPEPHDAVMIDCFEPAGEPVRYAALYEWHGDVARVTGFLNVPFDAMKFR